jgi:hypothetical protein
MMKNPWDWTEADLLNLIATRVQENIGLDYKRCGSLEHSDRKKADLSKDVSAFANSAGGTLVYGIVENHRIPVDLDVGYDPTAITKEWIEQVINSTIQRRIDGVRINQVELGARPGKVAYVVSVPQSLRAPHQAADKKFYKRFNFESVPMEEYEVRDVSRRLEAPDLRVVLLSPAGTDLPLVFKEGEEFSNRFHLKAMVRNGSPAPAEYAIIDVLVDIRLGLFAGPEGLDYSSSPETVTISDTTFDAVRVSKNWAIPGDFPLFDGADIPLGNRPFHLGVPRSPGVFRMGWQCRSPRMSPRRGMVSLDSTSGRVSFCDDS